MSTWHRFGQDNDEDGRPIFEDEAFSWTDVQPGDIVQSRGTLAYNQRDFIGRDKDTTLIVLHSFPVLVLARIPGIPGEEPDGAGSITFVCLSRHGILVVVQSPEQRWS